VRLPIYQGESDWADECVKLGELVLGNLTVERRAEVPIEVTFELSNEGTLSVRAVDTTTGMAEAIRVDSRTTLSTQEVERLSVEEAQYAQGQAAQDRTSAARSFQRLVEKAERLARALEKGAKENPSPEADAVVGQAKALVAKGRVALKQQDSARMAEVRQALEQLVALDG